VEDQTGDSTRNPGTPVMSRTRRLPAASRHVRV